MNKNTSPQRNGEITWIQKKNKKKIRLHPSLAIIVWRELREKYGIQQRKDKQGFPDWSCTREELGLITKLKIENPNRGTLKGISQLYNLQSLTVASVGSSEYKKIMILQL